MMLCGHLITSYRSASLSLSLSLSLSDLNKYHHEDFILAIYLHVVVSHINVLDIFH
jgi:hypothetical protein